MTSSLLIKVYLALMVLLALTVTASLLPLGVVGPYISLVIAMAKAALVMWFFMDLRESPKLTFYASLTGFTWLILLIVIALSDYFTRGHLRIFGK